MGYAKYNEDIEITRDETGFYGNKGGYSTRYDSRGVYRGKGKGKNTSKENIRAKQVKKIFPLIIVNDKVVNEQYCNVTKINSVIICEAQNEIYINGEKFNSVNKIEDITDKVNKILSNRWNVKLCVGDKHVKICKKMQGSINKSYIHEVVKLWNQQAQQRKKIEKNYTYSNQAEKKCLDGLYDYYIACITPTKIDKCRRYEDAFENLSDIINVSEARIVKKIIAFKYNWLTRMSKLCYEENDVFSSINAFLLNKEWDNLQTKETESNYKLFIEDELENIMEAIYYYQIGKYDKVEQFLRKYPFSNIKELKDLNYKDKILLLSARLARKQDREHDALKFYNEISSIDVKEEKKACQKKIRGF